MPYGITIIVLLTIIGVFIVYKALHEALDLVHILISVVGIILALAFFAVVYDAISFKRNFTSSESLLFVSENGKIVSGAVISGKASVPLAAESLEKASASFSSGDYKSVLGSYYKLIIVNSSSNMSFSQAVFDNPGQFMESYKTGAIFVYPETYMFKAIKFVPGAGSFGLFRDAFSRAVGKLNETSV